MPTSLPGGAESEDKINSMYDSGIISEEERDKRLERLKRRKRAKEGVMGLVKRTTREEAERRGEKVPKSLMDR